MKKNETPEEELRRLDSEAIARAEAQEKQTAENEAGIEAMRRRLDNPQKRSAEGGK